ncbi:MAG: PIN domain-containing protein [Fervidobacterium sp.]
MTIFIDTGIFIALRNADEEQHQRSKELMKKALKADYGRVFTSDYIIDEAVTTALVRTRKERPSHRYWKIHNKVGENNKALDNNGNFRAGVAKI